ncbi:uncharacterized protein LOC128243702 [Mya arenaria]|uniref:uncharacterized protein LOC128243702 n=1 Tax=Mya arenaria TaxID=6604 RepID=UPI0022DEC731|nr:uncharacterized protein LOC128243702 [Mya arenaria]
MFKRSIGDDGTQKEHCLSKIPKLAGHEDVSKKTGEIFDTETESVYSATKIEEETNVQYERQGSELERPGSSFTPDVNPLVTDVTPVGNVHDEQQGSELERPGSLFTPDVNPLVTDVTPGGNVHDEQHGSELERPGSPFTPDVNPLVTDVTPEGNVHDEQQESELERPGSPFTPDVDELVIEKGKADNTLEGNVQDERQRSVLAQASSSVTPDVDNLVIEKGKADVTLDRKSDDIVEDRNEGSSTPANDTKTTGVEEKRKAKNYTCILVDTEEKLKIEIACIKDLIKTDPVVALDCEGVHLSRKGELCLLSISTRKRAFLVDVLKFKSMAFDQGLKDILEDTNVKKLMFDCREDADALLHQFQVKLAGVLDMQLLEIIKRPQETPTRAVYRRCDKLHEVVHLKGLLRCMELFIDNKKLVESKTTKLGQISDWKERPLRNSQLRYAATDVLALFLIFDKLRPTDEEKHRLEIASARYVDLKRAKVERTYDEFEYNRYLPIDIIPEKGRTGFECGNISCTECRRKFPRSEFSNKQMREGTQKCRTCKRVQQDITTEEHRQWQFQKRDEEDDGEEEDYLPRGDDDYVLYRY